jgi:hypothetical protein
VIEPSHHGPICKSDGRVRDIFVSTIERRKFFDLWDEGCIRWELFSDCTSDKMHLRWISLITAFSRVGSSAAQINVCTSRTLTRTDDARGAISIATPEADRKPPTINTFCSRSALPKRGVIRGDTRTHLSEVRLRSSIVPHMGYRLWVCVRPVRQAGNWRNPGRIGFRMCGDHNSVELFCPPVRTKLPTRVGNFHQFP